MIPINVYTYDLLINMVLVKHRVKSLFDIILWNSN